MCVYNGFCVAETDKAYGLVENIDQNILWLPKKKVKAFTTGKQEIVYPKYGVGYSVTVDIDQEFADRIGIE